MLHRRVRILAAAGFAVLLSGVAVLWAQASLGTAQSFAVLGGSTVTNTGPTVLTGDLGVSPGAAITGFLPLHQARDRNDPRGRRHGPSGAE